MNEYTVVKITETNLNDFLRLPKKLYVNGDCPQNMQEERALILKQHTLSQNFEVFPYVVKKGREVVARCILTYYPDEDVAYVGFFESINDYEPVKVLFDYVVQKVEQDGRKTIVGPMDCSIFIKYRFKVDRFDKVYTGEPYNKEYYPALWERYGFKIKDKYISNQLRKVVEQDCDNKLQNIYNKFLQRGFDFREVTTDTYESVLDDIYKSIMALYVNFTGFHSISQKQFKELFLPLQRVLNYKMVNVVYKNDELKAFCIALPNYGKNTLGKLSVRKLLNINNIKETPHEYVILYVGASPSTPGLGGALIQHVRHILKNNGCTSIGALIKEGNLTGKLYQDLYTDQFHYNLYQLNASEKTGFNETCKYNGALINQGIHWCELQQKNYPDCKNCEKYEARGTYTVTSS